MFDSRQYHKPKSQICGKQISSFLQRRNFISIKDFFRIYFLKIAVSLNSLNISVSNYVHIVACEVVCSETREDVHFLYVVWLSQFFLFQLRGDESSEECQECWMSLGGRIRHVEQGDLVFRNQAQTSHVKLSHTFAHSKRAQLGGKQQDRDTKEVTSKVQN